MTQTSNYDLQDFLAETFLSQGNSISYLQLRELPAFCLYSENEHTLFVFPKEGNLPADFCLKGYTRVVIPVLKEEEQTALQQQVSQMKLKNVEIYRLSLFERYSFYSKQFQRNK